MVKLDQSRLHVLAAPATLAAIVPAAAHALAVVIPLHGHPPNRGYRRDRLSGYTGRIAMARTWDPRYWDLHSKPQIPPTRLP